MQQQQTTDADLRQIIAELRDQIMQLTARVEKLEAPLAVSPAPVEKTTALPPARTALPEETILVIAAAVAAYLGKRGHIRSIRLLTSTPWAQQGRVSIQASHQLDTYHG